MRSFYLLLFSSIFFLLVYGFQCDEEPIYNNIYEFNIPLFVQPNSETYSVNDTIDVGTVILDNKLYDLESGKNIEILCQDIPFELYIGVRHSNINKLADPDDFEVIVNQEVLTDVELETTGQYTWLSSSIALENLDNPEIDLLQIVCKQKGIFLINPFTFKSLLVNTQENCDNNTFGNNFGSLTHDFPGQETNPELIEKSPLPTNTFISGDRIPRLTETNKVYWFEVE